MSIFDRKLNPEDFDNVLATASLKNSERREYYCKIESIFAPGHIKFPLVECFSRPKCHKLNREYIYELWLKIHHGDPPRPPAELPTIPSMQLEINFYSRTYNRRPTQEWGIPLLGALSGMEPHHPMREHTPVEIRQGFILLLWDNVITVPYTDFVRVECEHARMKHGQLVYAVAVLVYEQYRKLFPSDEIAMNFLRRLFLRGLKLHPQQSERGFTVLRVVTQLAPE